MYECLKDMGAAADWLSTVISIILIINEIIMCVQTFTNYRIA